MRSWIDYARAYVEQVARELPADTALPKRRKLLREKGYHFHGGTFWGRRQYGKACREYLEQHGQPKRVVPPSAIKWPADIIFPFRQDGASQ